MKNLIYAKVFSQLYPLYFYLMLFSTIPTQAYTLYNNKNNNPSKCYHYHEMEIKRVQLAFPSLFKHRFQTRSGPRSGFRVLTESLESIIFFYKKNQNNIILVIKKQKSTGCNRVFAKVFPDQSVESAEPSFSKVFFLGF